ncbi:phosphate ABC transporter substrate-binding protein PstS [Cellulomonas bogoriensis]|uniref:Phosphate-binding protein n=1 Tax=Cellulomonas bogoriensis 69B4 = DSM 16987 TaxID=1386082 RepID=A0A0A0BYN3_9CELL|nr:phosphate ABC transporter substrate-binding protein PstS [Cellulomonas bogoriensis]KGM13080.1 phosphate ABC transporter substrate-binding protein [Cellulomonas bogoriensis 69B4 = DSM 16987]
MRITRQSSIVTALVASSALVLTACGGDGDLPDAPAPGATATDDGDAADGDQLSGALDGAGATFPNPVFQDWAFEYSGSVQPGVSINYQGIGSGGGIEQFLLQTVDFGSSERYLRDEDLDEAAEARGCEAIQFPVLFGAVTIAFGDEQLADLVLDAEAIAGIFQRDITNYNDPAIAELNPDMDLPDMEIIPVHRSDGSGTTSVFTTYLDHTAENWELGAGTEVQWPADTIGGQGNEGVTQGIQQNAGGVGYVNQAYALVEDLPTARVINDDGNAVSATLEATTEALEVLDIPDNFQFDILDVAGEGFPIAGANWIFVWECGYDENTGAMLRDYWTWATQSDEARDLAEELGYAPLGEGLRARVAESIDRINSQG